ncbi:hypothetical protein LL033_05115 [Clostridium estertheticum]|uniref:hypothetical protein n=1 Tax=Clostridium estertheticum TaxID=238834 RepID=UPI001C0D6E40|nr:hypothetical protein [Clostridium estertheticum]MBU3217449.1 hypothetical protein [Clostridium estertheticum]WAG56627.1 hypothetical protein LL033_05115 [Clostridium estertheticum]
MAIINKNCYSFINGSNIGTTARDGKIALRGPKEVIAEQLRERLKNEMTRYKKRKNIVEHPFGTIKRTMKFY